jgi:hypothetical protein
MPMSESGEWAEDAEGGNNSRQLEPLLQQTKESGDCERVETKRVCST